MTESPFARTTCGCKGCVSNCRRQPGTLRPGDLERILAHLGEPLSAASKYFWSSEGALVANTRTGVQFRIRTITPRYDRRKKACIFLDDQERCQIHAVAPFACSHFDSHMNAVEGHRRSAWMMTQIRDDADYHEHRKALPFADHYKPLGY